MPWVRRLLLLERVPSRAFFFAMAAFHVALKVVLGMHLTATEGYGPLTLVAPPQSVLLACLDVSICYAAAKVFEWFVPERFLHSLHVVVVGVTAPFLAGNFILHGYFKGFLNYGLLRFNGAGPVELLDYTLAGFDRHAALFVLAEAAIVFALVRSARRPVAWAERSPWPSAAALGLALGVLPTWEEAFYDLLADPHEERNLIRERRQAADAYRHEVNQWMAYLGTRPMDH